MHIHEHGNGNEAGRAVEGQLWNGKLAGRLAIISAPMSWSKPAHRTTEMGVQVAYGNPKKKIMQRAGFKMHQRG